MRSIVIALAATLFPLAAHAGENVAYTVDGEAFEGYRAKPTGASKGLVVIIHAWGGVTEYEQKRADMIAALGYDVFALDLYGKGNRPTDADARKREATKLHQDRTRMRKLLLAGLNEERDGRELLIWRSRSARTRALRRGQGYQGLCHLPRRVEDATGRVLPRQHAASPHSARRRRHLCHHGHVVALARELEAAHVPYEFQVYSGAPHGFTECGSDRYQKDADEKSWAAFADFLATVLGS